MIVLKIKVITKVQKIQAVKNIAINISCKAISSQIKVRTKRV